MSDSVSIIVPTYNEAGNILTLIRRIKEALPAGLDYEIVVVDDNSPDGTFAAVQQAHKNDPTVISVLRTKDRGLGRSVKEGIERSRGTRVVVMDADFTHDPAEIPRLLHVGEVYDIVSGSRFCAGGNMQDRRHYLTSLLYNLFLRVLLRTQVQDNLGGFFTIRRSRLEQLPLETIFTGYGDYFFRLIYFAQRRKLTLVELPAYYGSRTWGSSKSSALAMMWGYTKAAVELRLAARKLDTYSAAS